MRPHRSRQSSVRFRAFLPREEVQAVIDRELSSLDYGNFKNSFDRDNVSLSPETREERHDALFKVWGIMLDSQKTVQLREQGLPGDARTGDLD